MTYIFSLLAYLDVDTSTISKVEMLEYLLAIDYETTVLDETFLVNFLEHWGVIAADLDPELYAEVKATLGIEELPYDVGYILEQLEYVGYDITTVDQNAMLDYLLAINWDNFVLDSTSLSQFLSDMDIAETTFDADAWADVKEFELGIVPMPYDVHFILGLLDTLGVNTDEIDQNMMYEFLVVVDWDDFILDNFAMIEFFEYMGIEYTTFIDTQEYEDVKNILGIIDMEIDVNYIFHLLQRLGVDTDYISQTEVFEYLMAIDYDNFVLDTYALEQFFDYFGVAYEDFDPEVYAAVQDELGIVYIPYDVNYIVELLTQVNYDVATIDQVAMHEYLQMIDWANFVLDNYSLEIFFLDNDIDYITFNETDEWAAIKEFDLGIVELPYETNYVISLMMYLGLPEPQATAPEIQAYLEGIDYDNFVLDEFALFEFFDAIGADYTDMDETLWEEVKTELGVIPMTYEVNYIISLLDYIG